MYPVNFQHVLNKHCTKSFVVGPTRSAVLNDVCGFLSSTTDRGNQFAFLLGEQGVGKTALLANAVSRQGSTWVHYFVDMYNSDLWQQPVLVSHLYYSLGKIHGIGDSDPDRVITNTFDLQTRLDQVNQICRNAGTVQGVLIDGLDEDLSRYGAAGSSVLVKVLNSLKFPSQFRILLSSTFALEELTIGDNEPHTLILDPAAWAVANGEDIAEFLETVIPDKKISSDKRKDLAKACRSNFGLAHQVSRGIRSTDTWPSQLGDYIQTHIDSQFKNRANPLFRHNSDAEIERLVWMTMLLISHIRTPQTFDTICDIAHVGHHHRHIVLQYLRPFLSLGHYMRPEPLCVFNPPELSNYFEKKFGATSVGQVEVENSIVMWSEDLLKRGWISKYPTTMIDDALRNYSIVIQRGGGETLTYVRNGHLFRYFLFPPFCYHGSSVCGSLQQWALRSLLHGNPQEVVYYHLFSRAIQAELGITQEQVTIKETFVDQRAPTKTINDLLVKSGSETSRLVKLTIDAFLTGEITKEDAELALTEVYYRVKDRMGGPVTLWSTCKSIADEWFPESTTAPGTADVKNLKADEIEVLLDGKSKPMQATMVKQLREAGSPDYALIVDTTSRKVWHFTESIFPSDDAFNLACLVAGVTPGTPIRHVTIGTKLWHLPEPSDNNGISDLRDRIQKLVRRQIWNPIPALKEVVLTNDRKGVKIAVGCRVLVL